MNTNDIIMIPLNKLVPGKQNARKTKPAMSIPELAASIKAHGLLQNLVVDEMEDGTFSVEAGGRRLRALRTLVKSKEYTADAPIPCKIIETDVAHEASLAENVQRVSMHPADEIKAFAERIERGDSIETIAARFGYTPQHVARRLKLARVSPKLIALLRRDEIGLDQLAALAFSDDHKAQEAAFFEAPAWERSPERLKAQLMNAHVHETDKLARFVGLDAYAAEGGAVVSDMFSEDDTRWLADRPLLIRMAEARLALIAETVRGEGWAWVDISIDGIAWGHFPERVHEERRRLSKKQQAQHKRLCATLDKTEDPAKIEAIEAAIDALAPTRWKAEEVSLAGAIVMLTHEGKPKIERGLVKSENLKALKTLRRKKAGGGNDAASAGTVAAIAPRPDMPAKLLDELLAHKTLALRVEIARQPDLALRVLVFALAANAFGVSGSCLDARIDEADVSRRITRSASKAPAAYAKLLEAWAKRCPGDAESLWALVSGAERDALLELLAVLIAPGLEIRPGRNDAIGQHVAEAAFLDMSQWWTATPEAYFEHVRRDVVLDAMRAFKPGVVMPKLEKASKKEIVARAKRIFKGSTWLPEPLRVQSVQPPVDAIAAE